MNVFSSLAAKYSGQFLLAAALTALPTSAAHALNFAFRDISPTPMSAAQKNAFQQAGNYWSSLLSDSVTVYVDIGFAPLGPSVLDNTTVSFTSVGYSTLSTGLNADKTSISDSKAVASLQSGSSLSFLATQGDRTSRLDNDGSTNNSILNMTTANAKALGFATTTTASRPDGMILMASGFSSSFAYDRAGGILPFQFDFITYAERSLAQILGFTSGVSDIDYCAGPDNQCSLQLAPDRFENAPWYRPLDLFRYSGPGAPDVRVGGNPYFSIDKGLTSIEHFSPGGVSGYDASYFKPNSTNLMSAFMLRGVSYDASLPDLTAMDVIGWNLVGAVPEPSEYALMMAGLLTVALVSRWRRKPSKVM